MEEASFSGDGASLLGGAFGLYKVAVNPYNKRKKSKEYSQGLQENRGVV